MIGKRKIPLGLAPVRLNPAVQRRSEGLDRLSPEGAGVEFLAPYLEQLGPIPTYAAFGGFWPFAFSLPKKPVTALPIAMPAAS